MRRIIVDGDACPRNVLKECLLAGKQYNIAVWTVASFNHNIQSGYHIVVDNTSQEADIKIMNIVQPGDIVVTQDWGLAAMLLSRNVICLHPLGREYRDKNIEFMLEERAIKAKLRRMRERTRGPRKRTAKDDKRFAAILHRILEER